MAIDIAVVTSDCYEYPTEPAWYHLQVMLEDEYLVDALAQQGLNARRVSWSNPDFDWSACGGLVIRSTWDFQDRMAEFDAWLVNCRDRLRMFNGYEMLRWNLDKRYLFDLQRRGIRTVETVAIPKGDKTPLLNRMAEHGWDEAIVKPAISAGARHTYRMNARNGSEIESVFEGLVEHEDFLLQPFQSSVTEFGELSFMVMGGRFTHAVQKLAKPGDFRVQDDHGGTVVAYTAHDDEIAFAERVVAACDPQPVYARVDTVRNNDHELALMEIELVEPELFFRFNRSAAISLAESIAREL
ncbi:MAG: hypothetical protein DHS20C16_34260 [Phycisphaerae bacterium]|nr:MAG: hypothetical protein DHS20C16_34260 [Phycisphaerae bacterium]